MDSTTKSAGSNVDSLPAGAHDDHHHDHDHVHGPGCSHHHHHHQIETYVRSTPKTGRNDPCTCGSGKKFKKCCGGVQN